MKEKLNDKISQVSKVRSELDTLLLNLRGDLIQILTDEYTNKIIPKNTLSDDDETDNGVFVTLTNKHGLTYQYSYLLGVTYHSEYKTHMIVANLEGDLNISYFDEVSTSDLIELYELMNEYNINGELIDFKK